MKTKYLHPRIQEFIKNELPINWRSLSVDADGKLEERKDSSGSKLLDQGIVEGYGVMWDSINDRGERFVKGSFAKSIKDMGPDSNSSYKIKFRDEHGRACALMVKLKEDDKGLLFRSAPLDDVQWCRDLLIQLKSKTINNFSIGFKHCWDKVEWDEEEDCLVNLEAELFEISAVSIPSDIGTYAVRSKEEVEYMKDNLDKFINSLPRDKRLEARHFFAKAMTLSNYEQIESRQRSLVRNKPSKIKKRSGVDYAYLTKHFKL